MCFSNLIRIPTTYICKTNNHYTDTRTLQQKSTYTFNELLQIKNAIQQDRRYQILDSWVYIHIKELRINKTRKIGQRSRTKKKTKTSE